MQSVAENLIIQQFQQLRQELQGYNNKLMELEAEKRDHELVVQTIEPLESARKCYRLVGGVLVERTVGEVLPALKGNLENV
jgi:prefoldin subunit 2